MEVELPDEEATLALGRALARTRPAQAVIYLSGELGAGKTTFSRGFVQQCGHTGLVKSPTYTLMEAYDLAGQRIYHLDLYRLSDPEELEFLGIDELQGDNILLLVEWPERGRRILPPPDLQILLKHAGTHRRASLEAHQQAGEDWLAAALSHPGNTSDLILD